MFTSKNGPHIPVPPTVQPQKESFSYPWQSLWSLHVMFIFAQQRHEEPLVHLGKLVGLQSTSFLHRFPRLKLFGEGPTGIAPHDMSIFDSAKRRPVVYDSTSNCLLRLRYIVSCPSVPHVLINWQMQVGFRNLFDASSLVSPVEHCEKKIPWLNSELCRKKGGNRIDSIQGRRSRWLIITDYWISSKPMIFRQNIQMEHSPGHCQRLHACKLF